MMGTRLHTNGEIFMYYIFTFGSRTNAIKFKDAVRREGQRAELVSTPQSIGSGCGLSVKVDDPTIGKRVLSYDKYSSFKGVYLVKDYNGTLNITKK